MDFSLDLIERLAEVPNIEYIKFAPTNMGKVFSMTNRCNGKLKIFSATVNIRLLILMLEVWAVWRVPHASFPR